MTVTALTTNPARTIPSALVPVVLNDSGSSLTIYAGVANTIIEVWGYDLYASTATNLTFKTGTTDMSGPLSLPATGSARWPTPSGRIQADYTVPRFVTNAGESLVLAQSGSATLGGTIWINTRRNDTTYV